MHHSPRRRTFLLRPAGHSASVGARPIEPMECRLMFAALPIVNPGFDTLFKPGSQAVSATLAADTKTTGVGNAVAVVNAVGAAANAAYADGTSGTTVDVPGWTAFTGTSAGVEYAPDVYPGKTDNFAYIIPNSVHEAYLTQTLTGVSLQPNTTYVLTAVVGSQEQAAPNGSAFVVGLEAGSTQLTPTAASSPSPFPGTLPTTARTFVTGATPPSGDLTIFLGINAATDASEVDFDSVSLTTTPGAHPTPSPTPVPAVSATLSGPDITTLGQSTETITAVYLDPAGVDLSSVGKGNLMRCV